MDNKYDRAAEDLGNIVALEHVNVTVPDQQLATLFYVVGLGLTRDPYLMTSISNMWVNIGRSQFHLPTNKPQVVRGHVGIVVPDREALLKRLQRLRKAGLKKLSRTDPDSRFLRKRGGFTLGYTATLAVSEDHLIVAQQVTQDTNDNETLLPMADRVEQQCGEKPRQVSGDSGFFSNG